MKARLIQIGVMMMALVLFMDQFSKMWMLSHVLKPGQAVFVTPYLNFVQGWNKGVTFGFLNIGHDAMPFVIAGIAGLIVLFLARWLYEAPNILVALGLGSVMGGAIGNVMDRLRYGAVLDFLDVHYAGYHWYAFNIADCGIVMGVGLLLLDHLAQSRKKR